MFGLSSSYKNFFLIHSPYFTFVSTDLNNNSRYKNEQSCIVTEHNVYYKKIGVIYTNELVLNLQVCSNETLDALFHYFHNADLVYSYLFIYMQTSTLNWFFQFSFTSISWNPKAEIFINEFRMLFYKKKNEKQSNIDDNTPFNCYFYLPHIHEYFCYLPVWIQNLFEYKAFSGKHSATFCFLWQVFSIYKKYTLGKIKITLDFIIWDSNIIRYYPRDFKTLNFTYKSISSKPTNLEKQIINLNNINIFTVNKKKKIHVLDAEKKRIIKVSVDSLYNQLKDPTYFLVNYKNNIRFKNNSWLTRFFKLNYSPCTLYYFDTYIKIFLELFYLQPIGKFLKIYLNISPVLTYKNTTLNLNYTCEMFLTYFKKSFESTFELYFFYHVETLKYYDFTSFKNDELVRLNLPHEYTFAKYTEFPLVRLLKKEQLAIQLSEKFNNINLLNNAALINNSTIRNKFGKHLSSLTILKKKNKEILNMIKKFIVSKNSKSYSDIEDITFIDKYEQKRLRKNLKKGTQENKLTDITDYLLSEHHQRILGGYENPEINHKHFSSKIYKQFKDQTSEIVLLKKKIRQERKQRRGELISVTETKKNSSSSYIYIPYPPILISLAVQKILKNNDISTDIRVFYLFHRTDRFKNFNLGNLIFNLNKREYYTEIIYRTEHYKECIMFFTVLFETAKMSMWCRMPYLRLMIEDTPFPLILTNKLIDAIKTNTKPLKLIWKRKQIAVATFYSWDLKSVGEYKIAAIYDNIPTKDAKFESDSSDDDTGFGNIPPVIKY